MVGDFSGGPFDGFVVGPIKLPSPGILRTANTANAAPRPMVPGQGILAQSRHGSLRSRAMGVPADIMLAEALPALIQVIEEESGHQGCKIRAAWDRQADMYSIVVQCPKCDKRWRHNTGGTVLTLLRGQSRTTDDMASMWFHQEIVPFFMAIVGEECYGLTELQLMAEYLTRRLAAAEPHGLPYAQLVHEIILDGKAPAGEIERHLRKMNFDMEWVDVSGPEDRGWRLPVVRLPAGHPSRAS